jgi:hypothetical protein
MASSTTNNLFSSSRIHIPGHLTYTTGDSFNLRIGNSSNTHVDFGHDGF